MTHADDKRFRLALILLAATSFGAIILAAWALYARFEQGNDYRRADARIWRAVVCNIEMAVTKLHRPAAITRKSLRFYDRLLIVDVQTDGCNLIQTIPKGTP